MKQNYILLSAVALLLNLVAVSCSNNPVEPQTAVVLPETGRAVVVDSNPIPMLTGEDANAFLNENGVSAEGSTDDGKIHLGEMATAYPNYSFCLNVPFLPQVLPGTWSGTKNCGQAVGVMLGGAFNRGIVQPWVITDENRYLAGITGDRRYLDANGWYTGGSRLGHYRKMLWDYHRVNTSVYYGNHADDVVAEMAKGRPVIVGVMIKGGKLVSSGGVSHWALAVGWDGNIYLHDPGTKYGRYIRYSVNSFEKSWATQGKIYMPCYR